MFDFFQKFENIPYWKIFLEIIDKDFTTSAPQIGSNPIEISLWPWTLFKLNDFIIFRTSSSLKLIAGSLFSVFYKTVEGKILSFTIGVHCKVKKLFFKKYLLF